MSDFWQIWVPYIAMYYVGYLIGYICHRKGIWKPVTKL